MLKEKIEEKKRYIVKLKELIKSVDKESQDEHLINFVKINTEAITLFEKEIIQLEKDLEKENKERKAQEKKDEDLFLKNYNKMVEKMDKEINSSNLKKKEIISKWQEFLEGSK